TLTAWGTDRFDTLVAGIPLPFGDAAAQFEAQLTDAGLILFSDFFLVAMGVSLVAILPAVVMAWRPPRDGAER
ncbi:MAG: hypothetical protein IH956_08750, partial [Chloroflexi bacterium]|nr:hypothetical protein [Chloroflexota bacterium]